MALQKLTQEVPLLHNILGDQFNPVYLLILVLSIFAIYIKIRGKNEHKLNLPPSPPKLPIIGNLHQLSSLLHQRLAILSKKYGPDLMLLQLGKARVLVVSSAEMAKEVMKTHDIAFSNRPQILAPRIHFYGCNDVAFAPYGEYWRQTRKISVLELLSVKRVQSLQFVREEEVRHLVNKLHKASLDGLTVNLTDLLIFTGNNVVSRSILGTRFDEGIGKKGKFGDLARDLLKEFSIFVFGDFFPSLSWVDELRGVVQQITNTHNKFDVFLQKVIEEHKVKHASGQYDPDSDKVDFVDILLQVQRDGSYTDFKLTDDNIKAIIVDMLVGGSDSSSTTIEWTIAELIRSPVSMKKAQEEVRKVVGKKKEIDLNDLNEMNYLECVIKESLRLHPPGPLLTPRETSRTVKGVGGYDIPEKTRVLISVYSIQRDPKIWKNPTQFMPERFFDEQVDVKGDEKSFKFLPFGGGRRGCPGAAFAVASVKNFMANLLYWFDWKLPDEIAKPEDFDMAESPGISVSKKVPIRLKPVSYYTP